MRMAYRNKRPLWYSLKTNESTEYEYDENGNILFIEVDGEQVPQESGKKLSEYSVPKKFWGTIQASGGRVSYESWGIDRYSYDAILLAMDGELPLNETAIIWLNDPSDEYDPKTADYQVVRDQIALNQKVYLLKSNAKANNT